MTPRSRVLAALDGRPADRIPTALWGSWYGVTDRLYFRLLEHLGWEPAPPFRPEKLHSVNYYDDRLLARLGTDVRHVDPGPATVTARRSPEGVDGWGIGWDDSGLYRSARVHPLAAASVAEILAHPMPGPDAVQEAEVQARLAAIDALGDEYAVFGRAVSSYGLFEMAQALRKHDQLFLDFFDAPEVVDALAGRLADCYLGLYERFLDLAGDRLDAVELPGDDFAGNQHPIISPRMFDRFFAEPYRRLIGGIKRMRPGVKVIFHSDGAIKPFLPRLIALGVDAVHPLEPLPATDMAAIRRAFGGRIAFLGGIDIREALQGGPERVRAEVEARIDALGPSGYLLAPANHLQWDIPPENVLTLFDHAQQYGRLTPLT